MIEKILLWFRGQILVVLLLLTFSANAQTETFSDYLSGTAFNTLDTLGVRDTATWSTIDTVYSAKGFVVFEIDPQSSEVIKDSYSCSVTLNIDTWDSLNTMTSQSVVMYIDYDTIANKPYHNKAIYYIKDAYRIKVTVGAFVFAQGNGSVIKHNNLRLYAELNFNRSYSFNCSLSPNFNSVNYDAPRNQLQVNWSQIPGANSYDLEWAFFDDSSLVVKNFSFYGNLDSLFHLGATRINTSANAYEIPLIYSQGKLLYRVRGVKTFPGYQLTNTEWGYFSSWYTVPWHEPTLTWQYNVSFAEEGKRKEVISYHDGTLRNRQSVTRVNSVDTTVVAETIYDYQGRAAVQVLPAPAFNPQIRYYHRYNMNPAGDPYSWMDFDTAGCGVGPVPLSIDSGAARYYSDNNPLYTQAPFKYIPNSFGYPFSVTEFTPDNTGRVNRQSGVGQDLTLGSGHETQFYYAKPSQTELDRLFGNDVGKDIHYTQELTVDPNGQGSVAYKDAHDRVIATALTGHPPHNLDTLREYSPDIIIRTPLIEPSFIQDSSVTSSTSFLAKTPGTFTFYYSIFPDHLTFANCDNDSICYDCYYNIQVSISSLCSPNANRNEPLLIRNYQNYKIPNTYPFPDSLSNAFDTLCVLPDSALADTFQIDLTVGSYFISRVVTVSNKALDFYTDKFLRENTCISIDSFIQNELSTIDSSGCNLTCETCMDQLGDSASFIAEMFTELIAGGFIDTSFTGEDSTNAYNLYHKSYLQCMEICHPFDVCSTKRDLMISDLKPGGQYASYGKDPDGMPSDTSDRTSLFYWDGTHFNYSKAPSTPYLDEQGDTIFVSTPDGPKTPDQLGLQEFIDNFDESWAISLLKSHPESCYLEFCIKNSESNDYDAQMLEVETFAAADSLGFIHPLDNPNPDPFFVPALADGHAYLSAFEGKLHSYKTVPFSSPYNAACTGKSNITYTLWEYACLAAIHGQLPAGYDFCTDTLNIYDLCVGDQNVAWQAFKLLYLYEKDKYFALRENYFATSTCSAASACGNNWIGSDPLSPYHYLGHTGTCAGPRYGIAYKYKVPRFNHQGPNAPLTFADTNQANAYVNKDKLDQHCSDICHSYRNAWTHQLQDYCGNIDAATLNTLLNKFEDICKAGCDATHPLGSSTAADTSVVSPRDFQTAMEQILGVSSNSRCNAVVIDQPRPYEKPGAIDVNDIAFPKPSTCTCEKFDSLFSMMVAETGNYSLDSFQVYLSTNFQSWLSKDELEIIRSNCFDSICLNMSEAIRLPQVLSCNDCLPCDSISSAYVDYTNEFSLVLGSEDDPEIMADYINHRFGFHLSPTDYYSFMSQCSIDTIVANPPPDCNDIRLIFIDYLQQQDAGGMSLVDFFNQELLFSLPERDYSTWIYNCAFDTITTGFVICDTLMYHKAEFEASGLPADSFVVYINKHLFLDYNYMQYAAWILNCDPSSHIPYATGMTMRRSGDHLVPTNRSKNTSTFSITPTNANKNSDARNRQHIIDEYNRLKNERKLKSLKHRSEIGDSLQKSEIDIKSDLGNVDWPVKRESKIIQGKSAFNFESIGKVSSFIETYRPNTKLSSDFIASTDNLFIPPSESESFEMNSAAMMTSCFLLDSAVDLYNAIPVGLRPPFSMWMNHVLGATHTYGYYMTQLSACSITVPTYSPTACLNLNLLLVDCHSSTAFCLFANCLNDTIGIDFSINEYLEWFDSCGVNLIPCIDLQNAVDNYSSLDSTVRPPLTVYLKQVFDLNLTYQQWAKLITDCLLDVPSGSASCDSIAILYNSIWPTIEECVTPENQLNSILGVDYSWNTYANWLDSCNVPYIDCMKIWEAYNAYNLLTHQPPLSVWFSNYLGLSIEGEALLKWLYNCGIYVSGDPTEFTISCDSLNSKRDSCISYPVDHFADCMNSSFGLNFTLHEYILWLKQCHGRSPIPCEVLLDWYHSYISLPVRPPFTDYFNFHLNLDLNFSDYMTIFSMCTDDRLEVKVSCDTLKEIYDICASSQPPYLLSRCMNDMLGYNFSMSFYLQWLDSCSITHNTFNCELLTAAVGEFNCFQDTITLMQWLNFYFQANYTDSFYYHYLDECNISLNCCASINDVIHSYNCKSTLSLVDYMNDKFDVNLNIDIWSMYFRICGDTINCDTCVQLSHFLDKYKCSDTLTVYQHLENESGWGYTSTQWDSLIIKCRFEIPCHINCDNLTMVVSEYNCESKVPLATYLNTYFGFSYSDSTWLVYMDSCHIQLPCINCDKLIDVYSGYDCLVDSTIEYFFNNLLGLNYTQADYEYALEFCHINFDCDTCDEYNQILLSYPCHGGVELTKWFSEHLPHDIIDSVLIPRLDSCNINWFAHCIYNCDTLQNYVDQFPCNTGRTLWSWLNQKMHLSFTRYEWQQIFLACPMDTNCNVCVNLDSLAATYPCHSTFSLLQWVDSMGHFNYSDTAVVALLDTCNISWMNRCVLCDTLVALSDDYPCDTTMERWAWLNYKLNLKYTKYEWSFILANCPGSVACDSCQHLSDLVISYPCDSIFTLTQWIDSLSGWNYSDTVIISMLDSCSINWGEHCVLCDSLVEIGGNYPCDSTIERWVWLNNALDLSLSEYEWQRILINCPAAISCDSCLYLDSLFSSYPCDSIFTISQWIDSLSGWNYSDSTIISMLDSCNIQWMDHCVACDTLVSLGNDFPCDTSIERWVWLNNVLDLSLSEYEWERILINCPGAISCDSCDYLVTLFSSYPCDSIFTISQWIDSLSGWNYSDTTIISMLDSCNILWMDHCVACDTLVSLGNNFPCDTSIERWVWLNNALNLSLSEYEWERILLNCPGSIGCDSCDYLDTLFASYPCDSIFTISEWIDTLSGWNYSDSTILSMLDSCNIQWMDHCVVCDTLIELAHSFPCDTTLERWVWLNDTLNLSLSEYEWQLILMNCPGSLACDSCSYLEDIVNSYPCDSAISITQWIDSLTGWTYSDSVLISMLDSCNIDWLHHCIPNCDTLEALASHYPCLSPIPVWMWLNDTLGLSYSEYDWSLIYVRCAIDTTCTPCPVLDSLMQGYNCNDTISLRDYLANASGWNYSDSTFISMMDTCSIDWISHCIPNCDSINYYAGIYPCDTNITMENWLNASLDLVLTDYEWQQVFLRCPVSEVCDTCSYISSLINSYNCSDSLSLIAYLDSTTGWGLPDSIYAHLVEFCSLDTLYLFHCFPGCDSLSALVSVYTNSLIQNGLFVWLNDTMNTTYSDQQFISWLDSCNIDTANSFCETLDSLYYEWLPYQNVVAMDVYLNDSTTLNWNYNLWTYVHLLDSCGVDPFLPCDSLSDLTDVYNALPAPRPPYYLWLNMILGLSYPDSNSVNVLLDSCNITDSTYNCVELFTYVNYYQVRQPGPDLYTWLNTELELNFTVGQYWDWFTICDVDTPFASPCNVYDSLYQIYLSSGTTIALNDWMNDHLTMNFTYYEYVHLFNGCIALPLPCDTILAIDSVFDALPQPKPLFYLYASSILNLDPFIYTQSYYDALLISCGGDTPNPTDCDSLQLLYNDFLALTPPQDLTTWFNTQLTLTFDYWDYLYWFDHCDIYLPLPCDTLNTLAAYHHLHVLDLPVLNVYLDSLLGLSFSYPEYLHMLDSCGILMSSCDSLDEAMQAYLASYDTTVTPWDFVNDYLGKTWTEAQLQTELQTCHPDTSGSLLLCDQGQFPALADTFHIPGCLDDYITLAYHNAAHNYQLYKDSLRGEFRNNYMAHCLESMVDSFYVDGPLSEYHYTLYYYDQAGNLVATIPPNGVHPFNDPDTLQQIVDVRDGGFGTTPIYRTSPFATIYNYNSLNKPVGQKTPDAYAVVYFYDNVGRIIASQNGVQFYANSYSYTIYDDLGRVGEVGKTTNATTLTNAISRNPSSFAAWIAAGVQSEVAKTYYDEPVFTIPQFTQENLRNRVSSVTYSDLSFYDPSTDYYSASHYSYDISGNVKTLIQEVATLNSIDHQFKRIDYDYDLISGKVNYVYYQRDSIDQFTHHYEYDDDNRITHVYTSRDGMTWDEDAHYSYYMHGPLARVELGENKVQGIDYAYTLQGWMKGINSSQLDPNRDMGQDGTIPPLGGIDPVSRDAYGFNLGYFNQDYAPIGGSNFEANYNPTGGSTFGNDSYKNGSLMDNGLYNGNIRHSVLAMDSLNFLNIGYVYKYDQLNRLTAQRAYNGLDTTIHEWTTAAGLEDYKENVKYDPNGNILTYERNGTTNNGPYLKMDSLQYHYFSGTNMLDFVDDAVSPSNYSEDLDAQVTANYQYDLNGNIIYDAADTMQYDFNNNGKMYFAFTPRDLILNYFDPMGNKVETYTEHFGLGSMDQLYHVRDAQGNIMATYVFTDGWEYKLKELNIYGSSRLGVLNVDTVIFDFSTPTQPDFYSAWSGRKMYELTNHLGNVLSTVTDKKVLFDNNNDNVADWSVPEIATANDYYPFGMLMPGRTLSSADYRFGFNDKENLNDVKGVGKLQDYGMRIYDPRLGKFLSIDPIGNNFPWNSPYTFAENRVIDGIDLDGKEWSKTVSYDIRTGQFNVDFKTKIQVIDASRCESSVEENQKSIIKSQEQFSQTYTQFDKDKNINYSAQLEYEFVDANKVGNNNTITLVLKATTSDKNGSYTAGSTPVRPGADSQTNVISIYTYVDGIRRSDDDLSRTITHELGHSAGALHPWEIKKGDADEDIMQGVAPDVRIQENIMNSGANPDVSNRYYNGSGKVATKSTPGQLFKFYETIDEDKKSTK